MSTNAKVFRYSTRSQKTFILTVLHRILLAHASVTNEESKTAPAYVARFIRRVLSALSVESRAGSPGITEIINGNVTGEELGIGVDFFAELGLVSRVGLGEGRALSLGENGDGRGLTRRRSSCMFQNTWRKTRPTTGGTG